MILSLIVAVSQNNVIGYQNKLPWHMPADLQHFKKMTLHKPVIMGRKTFESIGRPLPNRRNMIISRQISLSIPGCELFHSLEDALAAVKNESEVMVIGGSHLYSQTLPLANRIYMTRIESHIEGDAFFPQLDTTQWQLFSEENFLQDEKNPYDYRFLIYERFFDK